MTKTLSSGGTDPGKKRTNNEDSFLVNDDLLLYAVADGIGGHQGGETASRIAMETLAEVLPGLLRGDDMTPPFSLSIDMEPRISALRYAITLANQKIFNTSTLNPSLTGMGTTVTVLLLWRDKGYLAHVGDSRAYRLRNGSLSQITYDHSLVAEQVRAGKITQDQARTSSHRHIITRAVGIDREVEIDHMTVDIRKNDRYLLCTDGLTEMVDDKDLLPIVAADAVAAAPAALIRRANEQGGVDNITAVVVKVLEID